MLEFRNECWICRNFGRVHRATEKATGRDVAIKVPGIMCEPDSDPPVFLTQVLSIDQEPELLEKEIAIMGGTVNEYLVGFIGYFVIKRQVAVSKPKTLHCFTFVWLVAIDLC